MQKETIYSVLHSIGVGYTNYQGTERAAKLMATKVGAKYIIARYIGDYRAKIVAEKIGNNWKPVRPENSPIIYPKNNYNEAINFNFSGIDTREECNTAKLPKLVDVGNDFVTDTAFTIY